MITLSAWDGDDEALRFWAKEVTGDASKALLFAEAATVPLLKGNVAWTSAKKPVPQYLAETEEEKDRPDSTQVPIEETGEPAVLPDESAGDRPEDPIGKLIEAVLEGADDEVRAYAELDFDGNTHAEIQGKLRWSKKRG